MNQSKLAILEVVVAVMEDEIDVLTKKVENLESLVNMLVLTTLPQGEQ